MVSGEDQRGFADHRDFDDLTDHTFQTGGNVGDQRRIDEAEDDENDENVADVARPAAMMPDEQADGKAGIGHGDQEVADDDEPRGEVAAAFRNVMP